MTTMDINNNDTITNINNNNNEEDDDDEEFCPPENFSMVEQGFYSFPFCKNKFLYIVPCLSCFSSSSFLYLNHEIISFEIKRNISVSFSHEKEFHISCEDEVEVYTDTHP
jgi:hypothetical protein